MEKKTYTPVSLGSRLFTATQLKFSVHTNEFLALYFASDDFFGATKPVLLLADNRSLTLFFFQSIGVHTTLWNCRDRVLFFNILLAHIPGRAISAAVFLSRMQTDPSLSLHIKLTDHVPMRGIETEAKAPVVTLSSFSEIIPFFEQSPNDEKFTTID